LYFFKKEKFDSYPVMLRRRFSQLDDPTIQDNPIQGAYIQGPNPYMEMLAAYFHSLLYLAAGGRR
jgi:hypothetical protein